MTRTRPWSEVADRLNSDPMHRARREEFGLAIRDVKALAQVRSELGLPDYEVDEEAQSPRAEVAHEEDPYVAAVRYYVELMGGRLEINAVFPDGTQTLLPDGRWVVAEAQDAERPGSVRERAAAHAD